MMSTTGLQTQTQTQTDDQPAPVELDVNPIFRHVDIQENDSRRLVFLYGYISKLTPETVFFYQELVLNTFYFIPRGHVVHAEPADALSKSSITKFVVYDDTPVTRVRPNSTCRSTAGKLADAVLRTNAAHEQAKAVEGARLVLGNVANALEGARIGFGVSERKGPGHTDPCSPECKLPDGSCGCKGQPDFDPWS